MRTNDAHLKHYDTSPLEITRRETLEELELTEISNPVTDRKTFHLIENEKTFIFYHTHTLRMALDWYDENGTLAHLVRDKDDLYPNCLKNEANYHGSNHLQKNERAA